MFFRVLDEITLDENVVIEQSPIHSKLRKRKYKIHLENQSIDEDFDNDNFVKDPTFEPGDLNLNNSILMKNFLNSTENYYEETLRDEINDNIRSLPSNFSSGMLGCRKCRITILFDIKQTA